jgi:transglutaminase-like putative cysteine protease
MNTMQVKVGADFTLTSARETPAVFMIRPEARGAHMTLDERWETEPFVAFHDYADIYGNVCRRLTLPAGRFELRYDAVVAANADLDPYEPYAVEHPIAELPDEALVYTLPSRFCPSDLMYPQAMDLFGNMNPGWGRVQAICDFVHNHITFGYGSSTPVTTALDVYQSGAGVCRDFAHLAVTFCRALNIPARYSFGYMPDIDIPPPYAPMDFCAWFEVFLGGRWFIFDARNNVPRRARVTIARGRDALDTAMLTSYGSSQLNEMIVRADVAEDYVRTLA